MCCINNTKFIYILNVSNNYVQNDLTLLWTRWNLRHFRTYYLNEIFQQRKIFKKSQNCVNENKTISLLFG